jgi:hypothetical protein
LGNISLYELQVRLQARSRLAGGGRHFSFSKKEK